MQQPKDATQFIIDQQKQVRQSLPFDDKRDFVNAGRGLRGRLKPNTIKNSEDDVVWDNDAYGFLENDSPDTANPSLWRQSRLAHLDGLYLVTEGIYQVRGLDLSNTTIIEGEQGLIVIDPLTSKETGTAALALYREQRGTDRAIRAIIYTHSHADHFGGVKGFISDEDVATNDVKILAPEGFLEHAVSENVFTGTSMSRRAAYMYGAALHQGPKGQIGAGLGQTISTGTVTLIAPNVDIKRTGEKKTIDGIEMVFQMAPDTEAPAEMLIYFPQFKALCAAEDATHTFHNILTLRGAVVRDPHSWAKYLTETIDLFGSEAEVVFASHHWPTWGSDNVREFLTFQRDLYAYVHDQTLRLLNKGYNGPEIAEMLTLPPALDQAWNSRGYYGSLNHNVKAIYQRYCGWFDGNPAHLWEHTPVERAKRYVELAGGERELIRKGREAFNSGDFRWAAEVLNHAVFSNPENPDACNLLADVYEQLGYGAENGTWRNFFISGTTELRSGNFGTPTQSASDDVARQLTPDMVFDSLAIQINGPEAWDKKLAIDVVVSDAGVTYRLWLSNAALVYSTAPQPGTADVTMTGTTKQLPALVVYGPHPKALEKAGIQIDGDRSVLHTLSRLLDPGDPDFNIVTP
ncbi:Metallo-hydrolase/oxidoreductase [Aspergillus sclerotioniger CBS 115572]|uniref:Metallo-hydrolase/oxidoreductase n=1 Tax=Aspergillus sclerotioniger CBS 115572 TaxID=1450535 RepID=A0A317V2Q5_9EURO|nr:Metallo-hydrolase/oxidoreductase [Aspergillus sclerotioniger CBS 115572]PWY68553.1 Metallo-hydrolase/oxidoreductase [Aspergillus sclerotioniger CBS 115572]